MENQEAKTEETYNNKDTAISEYLIRKYGKEPKITEKEMKQIQWNWH